MARIKIKLDLNFGKVSKYIDDRVIRDSVQEAAIEVLTTAAQTAPVDTGWLKDSGEVRQRYDRPYHAVDIVFGAGVDDWRAPVQEIGSPIQIPGFDQYDLGNPRGIRAQPYLLPALHDNEQKIMRIFQERLLSLLSIKTTPKEVT